MTLLSQRQKKLLGESFKSQWYQTLKLNKNINRFYGKRQLKARINLCSPFEEASHFKNKETLGVAKHTGNSWLKGRTFSRILTNQ